MPKARAHVIISGIVQGVYFRAETRDQALALCMTGWVKNRSDGSVEGLFEGERSDVEKLIAWCRQGPPDAEVSDVAVVWESYSGEFPTFKIAF